MEDLIRLADMLYTKNSIDSSIAALIGRPTATGNIGEFIASRIFSIALEKSASAKDRDGHFLHGPLAGQSVDIKFYGKQEGILDLKEDVNVDYLLVLTGPIGAAVTAKGTTRPLAIEYVYLFDARKLVMALLRRPVKVGVATSVAKQY